MRAAATLKQNAGLPAQQSTQTEQRFWLLCIPGTANGPIDRTPEPAYPLAVRKPRAHYVERGHDITKLSANYGGRQPHALLNGLRRALPRAL
eukprot:10658260-Lingulodinium_polyedra.AAC.1